jgi:hypothetical protein
MLKCASTTTGSSLTFRLCDTIDEYGVVKMPGGKYSQHVDSVNVELIVDGLMYLDRRAECPEDVDARNRVGDVSQLKYLGLGHRMVKVTLANLPNLKDLSGLCGMGPGFPLAKVTLSNLPSLTDVSALKGVDEVVLENCPGVTDLSDLEDSVKRIHLIDPPHR